jgi:hypothetical protein
MILTLLDFFVIIYLLHQVGVICFYNSLEPKGDVMAMRQLIPREGETMADTQPRETFEAPNGRCGDYAKPGEYQGCGTPLTNDGYHTCPDFPDCCRP